MRGLMKFGAAAMALGLLMLMIVALFGALMWRFGLVSIKPALFYFAFGLVLIMGGGIMELYREKFGRFFAIAGSILFVIGMYKSIWPNTAAATSNAQEVADIQAARALNSGVAPKPIRCDRDSKTQFWDQVTGKAIVFYVVNPDTHSIECSDREGFHPFNRNRLEYKEVTAGIIAEILKQVPPPAPAPVVVAAPPPTTLPQIADAPVARPTPASEPAQQKPREYSITAGATFTVALTEPIDLGVHGENYLFTARLGSDLIERDGVVLAKAGSPVGMRITSLKLDRSSRAVYLEVEATSLTTTDGTPIAVHAGQDGFTIVRRRGHQLEQERHRQRPGRAGIPQIRDLDMDGQTGNDIAKGQYVLSPSQMQLTLERRWTVPATLLADGR